MFPANASSIAACNVLKYVLVTINDQFDAAIGEVLDVPGDWQSLGECGDGVTKADSLHTAAIVYTSAEVCI